MAVAFISFFVVFVVLRSVTNVRRSSLSLGASSALIRQNKTNNSIEEGNLSTKLQLSDSFLTQDLTLKWQKTNNPTLELPLVQLRDSLSNQDLSELELPEVLLSDNDSELPEVLLSDNDSFPNQRPTLNGKRPIIQVLSSQQQGESPSHSLEPSQLVFNGFSSWESDPYDYLAFHMPPGHRVTLMCNDEKVDFFDITELTGGANAHTVSAVASGTSGRLYSTDQLVVLKVPKLGNITEEQRNIAEVSKAVETINFRFLNAVQVDHVCEAQKEEEAQQPYEYPFNDKVLVITPYVDQEYWVDCCPENDKGSEASRHMFEAILAFHVALDFMGYMDLDHPLDKKNVFCREVQSQGQSRSDGEKQMWMYDFDQLQTRRRMSEVYDQIKDAFLLCFGERTSESISDLAEKFYTNETAAKFYTNETAKFYANETFNSDLKSALLDGGSPSV